MKFVRLLVVLGLAAAVASAAWYMNRLKTDDTIYPGYVEGEYIDFAVPVSGTLETLSVTRGERVAEGAPLFALNTTAAEADVAQAEAGVERAEAELADLDAQALRRRIVTPSSGQRRHIELDGESLVNFTSNNYLGLSTDPRVIAGAVEATERYGASVSAARLLCGSTPLHDELEQRLAALKDQEACLLYGAGFLANLGVLSTLVGEGDVIISDELNHASIIDGCRLSRASSAIYRHCDLDDLERVLAETEAERRLIVTETVFSMDGDIARRRSA